MGVMIDGRWDPERDQLTDADTGEFVRAETTFRGRVESDGPHPPTAGRYHLYISRACPWAHRTTVVRAVKGLHDAISVDVVDPVRENDGWRFSPDLDDCTPDTVNGHTFLREVYRDADPAYTGRVTVPVLWDREAETIVNNESSEIIEIFDRDLEAVAGRDVTLVPEDMVETVRGTIEDIYAPINNGVYKCGFAEQQGPYDEAVDRLFDALVHWDDVLAAQRYLCGDRLTTADICLFTTLYRFDEVYHTHFKCNHRRIVDFEHLWGHTREIYQLPGVAETCNMAHCKEHYYRSHTDINPKRLVPKGPQPTFEAPHGRDHLSGEPPVALQASGN